FHVEGLEELEYLTFFFPGVLLMVVLFTTVFATMAVIEDRQHGFLQQLAVAPTSRLSMVLGKTAGVTTVAAVQLALCLLAAPLAGFQLMEIHWPGLLVAALLGCVSLTGISFTMAWMVQSTHAYHALMSMVLLPLWMVSGAMFPPGDGLLGGLMSANPMTYMVDGLRHGLHGGVAPVAQVGLWTALGVLAVSSVLSLGLAVVAASRSNRWRP
ncbi:MAG: ABC transporter permease, partial [Myxococcota bacterium]|nr:ABC transporter permease [Myxococcota bacterium]